MGTLVRPRMGILTCRTPHELITSIWWISQGFAGTIYRKPSFLKLHNVNMALINPPTIKYANSRFKIINPPRNKVRQLFFPVFFRFFPLVFVFLFGKVSKKKSWDYLVDVFSTPQVPHKPKKHTLQSEPASLPWTLTCARHGGNTHPGWLCVLKWNTGKMIIWNMQNAWL